MTMPTPEPSTTMYSDSSQKLVSHCMVDIRPMPTVISAAPVTM